MTILDIIEKKRDKKELSKQEIEYFVQEYTKGTIADYQASALIMAIFINGMTKEETTNLTLAMANSGEVLNLSDAFRDRAKIHQDDAFRDRAKIHQKDFKRIIVDKHSTGGVGDKVSLILLPLVASCGVPVAKMSGRGLGFTGGTADKLEAIPGYQTGIDIHKFIQNVENIGISMITQTLNLAPADKKIYALRDSISCVESIPLIASSIMSKKIASGADKIVLDVTVGSGAFMKSIEDAEKLAKAMIDIGNLANRETVCVLTNMDEPLGYAVGNTLEVKEAVEALKGNMPEDLRQVVLELGAYMLKLANIADTIEDAKKILIEKIQNGEAFNKFIELVQTQGGDTSYITNLDNFEKAQYIEPVYSQKSGYVQEINAKEIGKLACSLGAGRVKKDDKIDMSVGIVLKKKVGEYVEKDECLGYLHINNEDMIKDAKEEFLSIIKIEENKSEKIKTILKIVS